MPSVTFQHPDGREETVTAVAGATVMRTAVSNGVEGIIGECGGQAMCATCHVYVDDAYLDVLPPMTDEEDEMLDDTASPRDDVHSRLGCQLRLGGALSDIRVRIPEEE